MRHHIRILEDEPNRFAGLDANRWRGEGQVLARLDLNGAGLRDLFLPRVGHAPGLCCEIPEDWVGRDRSRNVTMVGRSRYGASSLCTVKKRSHVFAFLQADMQVQLVHRLKIGNLEEERAPIRQHLGRRDNHGIMAWCAVVTR